MINEIKRSVTKEVDSFYQRFDEMLLSRSQWLTQAVEHLSKSTGKMVRSIMTTLMAGMLRGEVVDKAVTSAILLYGDALHDDVIDKAETRQGRATLNAIYDNRVAVLMGDFVLSSGLIGAIATRDMRIIGIVSAIGKELTEGEIRQIETADKVYIDEDNYMDVIR